jgi:L-asparaginase II
LQRRVLSQVARFSGIDEDDIALGKDGCGLPTYRLSLAAIARIYVALVTPQESGLRPERRAAVEKVAAAMISCPRMVAGPDRFTTRLMEASGGRLLAKEGAMGLFAVAVREPRRLGVVVKVADGAEAARDAVVVEVLRQLDCLSATALQDLATFHRPVIRSHAGERVGELVPDLELGREAI